MNVKCRMYVLYVCKAGLHSDQATGQLQAEDGAIHLSKMQSSLLQHGLLSLACKTPGSYNQVTSSMQLSQDHGSCSEDFYKKTIKQHIDEYQTNDPEEKKAMLDILRRISDGAHGEGLDETQEDDDEEVEGSGADLISRLADIDLGQFICRQQPSLLTI